MDAAESLFNPMTDVEKQTSSDAIRLSDDPSVWQQEIHQVLSEAIHLPYNAIVKVNIKPTDEDESSATGSVEITMTGVRAVVPIIIKGQMLCPLDVFYIAGDEETIRPLTQDNFSQVVARQVPDQSITARSLSSGSLVDEFIHGEGSSLGQGVTPPRAGTVAFGKYASEEVGDHGMLDDMLDLGIIDHELMVKTADSMNESLVEQFRDMPALVDDFGDPSAPAIPKVAYGLSRIIRKVHEAHEFNPRHIVPEDVFQILKTGPAQFRLHACVERTYLPRTRDMGASEVRDLLEHLISSIARDSHRSVDVGQRVDGLLSQLMREGEITITTRSRAKKPDALIAAKHSAIAAETTGCYGVRTVDGLMDKGVVFANVTDFDGESIPTSVYVSMESGDYAVQESIAGHKSAMQVTPDLVSGLSVGTGPSAMLVWWPEGGAEPRASVPFLIERYATRGEEKQLDVELGLGRKLRLTVEQGLQNPMPDSPPSEAGRLCYRVPASAHVVYLAKACDLTSSPAQFSKVATQQDGLLSQVWMTPHTNRYHVKIGSRSMQDLSRPEARLLLATCGADSETSKQWLDKAASGEKVTARGMLDDPILSLDELDKVASEHVARHDPSTPASIKVREFVGEIRKLASFESILKLSAMMPDGSLADRTMAAAYLTPQNVDSFKRYVKDFRRTASRLARLLLFARVTGKLDEVALKRSMMLLDRVANGLEGLGQLSLEGEYR